MLLAETTRLLLLMSVMASCVCALRRAASVPVFNRQTKRFLNRILCEPDECSIQGGSEYVVDLPSGDYRAEHMKNILKLQEDDYVKVGVLGVGVNDFGRVCSVGEGGFRLSLGARTELRADGLKASPPIDLILAVPRPQRLERLIPVISSMGVRRIILVGGTKVEKAFFGSHLIRIPNEMRKLLIEGLSQSCVDFMLPELLVRKDLVKFMRHDDIAKGYAADGSLLRLIAHPYALEGDDRTSANYSSVGRISAVSRGLGRAGAVIAIGPEGGWVDDEVRLFQQSGFTQVGLGPRILRTDVAVPVLLGQLHELLDRG